MNIIPFPQRPEMSLEALGQTCLNYLGETQAPIVPLETLLAYCHRVPSLAQVSSDTLLDFLRQHDDVEVLDGPSPMEAFNAEIMGTAGIALGPRAVLKRRIPSQREMYAIMALQLQEMQTALGEAESATDDPARRAELARARTRGEELLARLGTLMR